MLLTDLAYPAAWRDEAAAVAGALKRYDRYIVCGHAHLDGDALASVTAAGFLLRALGREFVLYSVCPLPRSACSPWTSGPHPGSEMSSERFCLLSPASTWITTPARAWAPWRT